MKKTLLNAALVFGFVSFSLSDSFANLIISQYYEGASNDKWIEITNVGNSTLDISSFYLALFANSRADNPGGSSPNNTLALSGTLASGASLLFRNTSAVLPSYASGTVATVCGFNGDDLIILTTATGSSAWANRTDVVGNGTSWGSNTSFYRNAAVLDPNMTYTPSEWTEVSNATVNSAMAGTTERLGEHDANILLPVTLTTFTAKSMAQHVELNWATASEEDNDYFSVEHSTNGRDFVEIDQILGAGTTFAAQSYSFIHKDAPKGMNYYRLRQVDFDGVFAFSSTQVVELDGTGEVSVRPTLADTQVTISFEEEVGQNTNVEIINLNGQVVKTALLSSGANLLEINVNDLTRGYYFIRLNNGATAQNLKFIKQ